ncbi:MAG: type II toxin-antitoxin system RelE/ParE family toxin [Candidatus Gracilibacteria bacterium]|nr:type II toxin-antitoxin system RelE/ParE family toxin [Candidatus Gracilibacteria bacterium]
MYNIKLEKKILKFLDKHKGENIINIFIKALSILKINPYKNNLDVKLLKGKNNYYRLRIGKYRFIYEIIENKLVIIFTNGDTRGDIYK